MKTVNTTATNETDGQRKRRRTPYRPMPKMIGDRFVNIEEIALRLGCTPRSIYRYAGKPGFPVLLKNGFGPRARNWMPGSPLFRFISKNCRRRI